MYQLSSAGQRFFFSRCNGLLTPKIVYFYCEKMYVLDQSILKIVYSVLKAKLMVLACSLQVEITRMLLECSSVDCNKDCSYSTTPLTSACAGGHLECVLLLLLYGASMTGIETCLTPLGAAAAGGCVSVFRQTQGDPVWSSVFLAYCLQNRVRLKLSFISAFR